MGSEALRVYSELFRKQFGEWDRAGQGFRRGQQSEGSLWAQQRGPEGERGGGCGVEPRAWTSQRPYGGEIDQIW